MEYLVALADSFLSIVGSLQDAAAAVPARFLAIDEVLAEDIRSLAALAGISS